MSQTSRTNHSLTRRATFRHWMAERVRWSDTDMVGHVNNLAFAAYLETGRTHFMYPMVNEATGERALFLLARLTVDYLDEVHWPAAIDIGTGILALGRASLRLGQGLFDGDRCVAVADSVMVRIDETSRNSAPIPDWARARFAPYLIDAGE